jgi:hypothetical protein
MLLQSMRFGTSIADTLHHSAELGQGLQRPQEKAARIGILMPGILHHAELSIGCGARRPECHPRALRIRDRQKPARSNRFETRQC